MLQPGERIDNHDKVCAEYYSTLLAMGAYDDEYAFFGTTYIEDGIKKAFISSERIKVYNFVRACRERDLYPSIVESMVKRVRVHAGEKEIVGQNLKYNYAEALSMKYPKDFLEDLKRVALCSINNLSESILNNVQNDLEGCFDEDALTLFEGAVEFAYEGKILTSEKYYDYKAWLKVERDFLIERVHSASNFKRTLTGFVYEKNKSIKYYTNAVEERTHEKRTELMARGQRVTPIFRKDYFFNSFGELPLCLTSFDEQIRKKWMIII